MENVKTNNKTELTFMEFCEKKKTDYSEFFDLEMCDKNKTWKVVYHDNKDGYFPNVFKHNNRERYTKNIEQKHIVHSIYLYCKERGLYVEGGGNKVSGNGESISWGSTWTGHLPQSVFPMKYGTYYPNKPFYEDKDYKKYIEDNNGKCPLPLPNLERTI